MKYWERPLLSKVEHLAIGYKKMVLICTFIAVKFTFISTK